MVKYGLMLLKTIAVALCGALIFSLLNMPLPWMLGPLFGVAAWRLTGGRALTWPTGLRQAGLMVLGYMLGISFTKEAGLVMINQLPYMAGSTVLLVIFSLVLGLGMAKKTKIGTASGLFGSVPGGLSQVLMLSEEIQEVDKTTVTLMQTIRATAVIFLVPFITLHGLGETSGSGSSAMPSFSSDTLSFVHYISYAGAVLLGVWGGKLLRLPARFLTGPLLATATLVAFGVSAPHLPTVVIVLAQLSLGIHLGRQIKRLENAKKLLMYTLSSSLMIVIFSLFIAYLLTKWTHMDLHTAFLSTAPGGIAEMGLTASIVHADMSLVSGYQLFRIFFIMFLVIPLLQVWIRNKGHKIQDDMAS
ncbi:AbrB family transcriptional regulator [Ammoniphilus sp. 3BR4]|uniref:AbrB family transcriptional regulator n=1 Tax=Ammoniphilus sp. 3BR4 TaxID=3158265 RepID=UPI0034655CA1